MEGEQASGMRREEYRREIEPGSPRVRRKRWTSHAAHERISIPCRPTTRPARPRLSTEPHALSSSTPSSEKLIVLDGSRGEGGGQILRSALSLSLLTGRPLRLWLGSLRFRSFLGLGNRFEGILGLLLLRRRGRLRHNEGDRKPAQADG